jgi:hypothetical protein
VGALSGSVSSVWLSSWLIASTACQGSWLEGASAFARASAGAVAAGRTAGPPLSVRSGLLKAARPRGCPRPEVRVGGYRPSVTLTARLRSAR